MIVLNNLKLFDRGIKLISIYLHSQGPKGSVENLGRSPRFSTFPRDLANVNDCQLSKSCSAIQQNIAKMKITLVHYIL